MELLLPVTAQLEITDDCNFRCQHCYLLDDEVRPESTTLDERVMRIAETFVKNKIYNVVLTGGEPMTRPRLLKKLVAYLSTNNINVNINTNLTLLTDSLLECFKQYEVRSLLVSCPSGVPEEYEDITRFHGKFHIFERNLRKLAQSGLHFSMNMVVNQLNKHSIFRTAEFLKACGATSFGATPMALNPLYPRKDLLLSNDEVRSLLEELMRVKRELGMNIDVMEALPKCAIPEHILAEGHYFTLRKCQAGISVIAVSHTGHVRPCTHNTKSYGNVLEEELTTIWGRMSGWRNASLVPGSCKDCALLAKCHGGCRINAKTMCGRLDGDDIWTQKKLDKAPAQATTPLVLTEDTQVRLVRGLKTRDEGDYVLVCGRTGRQVALVNREVEKLLGVMGTRTMSLGQLAALGDTTADDPQVERVVRYLIGHRLMKVVA